MDRGNLTRAPASMVLAYLRLEPSYVPYLDEPRIRRKPAGRSMFHAETCRLERVGYVAGQYLDYYVKKLLELLASFFALGVS